jgi:hypothetical protein
MTPDEDERGYGQWLPPAEVPSITEHSFDPLLKEEVNSPEAPLLKLAVPLERYLKLTARCTAGNPFVLRFPMARFEVTIKNGIACLLRFNPFLLARVFLVANLEQRPRRRFSKR